MADRMQARVVVAGLLGSVMMLPAAAFADAVLDGTTGSTGSFAGDFEIPASVGRRAGGNLFHSFERFAVRRGESATFTGPAGIDNVISRVTGGEVSKINGQLASTIPGADFFFLNPAGVVFGPQARLNVGGSFHVSTADELRFADGARFSAMDPAASSFTVAQPEAFGFLGADAGRIEVRGSILATGAGATLSMVGGTVQIRGSDDLAFVAAPNGMLNLVSVRQPGVVVVADGRLETPPVDRLGKIVLKDGALVFSGLIVPGGDVGTSVRLRASQVLLIDGSLLAADNFLDRDIRGGGVDVVADEVIVSGSSIMSSTDAGGRGGQVAITARHLLLEQGAEVSAESNGGGAAGDIRISSAGGRIILQAGSELSATSFGDGDAGVIEISAQEGELLVSGNSLIASATRGSRPAGAIRIIGERIDLRNSTISTLTAGGEGIGGDVELLADRILVRNGTVDSSTAGAGDAGSILIAAQEDPDRPAERLLIRGPIARVQTNSFAPDAGSPASVTGDAGEITINAERLKIVGGGLVASASLSAGAGGSIQVDAGRVEITGESLSLVTGITSNSFFDQDAGDIEVLAADNLRLDGGIISSAAGSAGGGRITIEVGRDAILLTDSQITSAVIGGETTTAGNVTLDADRFLVLDRSEVRATADLGRGGNLQVSADQIIQSADSDITASALRGIDGTVAVTAPDVDVLEGLEVLPTAYIDVSGLLRESCAARASEQASSFVGAGSQGLASGPTAPLAGTYAIDAVRDAGFHHWTLVQESDCHD